MQQFLQETGQVALTSLLSLVSMFVFTRLSGKRQISQMSPFDYLNAVTVGSIAAEITALVIYGAVTRAVEYTACKSIAMRTFWSGRSMILMKNGVISKANLQRASIDLNEFLGQARLAGYFDPNEIETAILENNGQISFLPASTARPATPKDLGLRTEPATAW